MAENRRFYYLKLKENFYNSETMVVLKVCRTACCTRICC